jgi:tRNA G18 (ribose-2'-O)-methylase SpoU
MMKTKSKKEREKRREIILEGRRLIIDALKANVVMKALYFSKFVTKP